MNCTIKIFAFFILCMLASTTMYGQSGMNKYALLVGVGDYAEYTDWDDLVSVNDIELLKGTLLKKGFLNEHIFTIKNGEATRGGIVKALKEFENKLQPGNIVYFHFSGHGQQVWDDNGDEIDGLDEAFVPHNSPKFFNENSNKGDSLLRDDFLEEQFLSIRKKIGKKGHLLVTIDACHSGTATRGLAVGRGSEYIMASETFLSQKPDLTKPDKSYFSKKRSKVKSNELAPMVSIFSSGANQFSYEIKSDDKGFGIFTNSLCKQLLNAKNEDTYAALFSNVKNDIGLKTKKQSPQIEGFANSLIFNGELKEELSFFSIGDMISRELVLLEAGTLSGLTVGTEIVFYSKEITDTSGQKPIAIGVIDEATPFDSDVVLNELTSIDLRKAKAFIRKKNFGLLALNLKISLGSKTEEEQMKKALNQFPFLKVIDEQPDLFLDKKLGFAGVGSYDLLTADETILFSKKGKLESIDDLTDELGKIASQYAQSQFLKSVSMESKTIKPEAIIYREITKGNFQPVENLALKEGEIVKIKINNKGDVGFYFSAIDITPDYKSTLIIPFGKPAADFYLPPGGHYFSDEFEVGPPYGLEVLKIIATETPLNLKRYIQTRGVFDKTTSPLEVLLAQSFYPGQITRGTTTASVYAGENSISTLIFEIFKKD